MIELLKKFERGITIALIGMMALLIFAATIELGWIILKNIFTPPVFLPLIKELLEIFGFFMLVLIGIELLATMKAYLDDNTIHVEIVLEVALIAIARKVIILDIEKYDGLTIIGTAVLIIAVAAAWFVVKAKMKNIGDVVD